MFWKEKSILYSSKVLFSIMHGMKSVQELQQVSDPLCHIIGIINTKKDAFNFLRDLLTEAELIEFSQRLIIAYMLEKKMSYKDIEAKTGASSTTIARVSKYLQGEFGGYKKYISYLS